MSYENFPHTIDAGATSEAVSVLGRSFIVESSSDTLLFRFRDLDGNWGSFAEIPEGKGFKEHAFNAYQVKNLRGVDVNYSVVISQGVAVDMNATISGSVSTKSGDNIDNDAVNVTDAETLVVAVNTSRNRVEVFNNDSSDRIYVGKAGVTVSNGMPVEANQSRFFDSGASVYAICEAGKSADVRYLEELE